jgi:hypothetical protein
MDWFTSYCLITVFVVLVLGVFKVHFFKQLSMSKFPQRPGCPTQFYLTLKPFVSEYLYRKICLDPV